MTNVERDQAEKKPRLSTAMLDIGFGAMLLGVVGVGAETLITSGLSATELVDGLATTVSIGAFAGGAALFGAGLLVSVGERSEQRRHESATSS